MNPHAGGDAIAVGKLVRLANRRGLQRILGRSRIATCGRLFEGTDEISLGQTSPARIRAATERLTTATTATHFGDPPSKPRTIPNNVAERLAPEEKTVSFWQCRFDNGMATDNEAGMPRQSRAHRAHHHCDEPRPAASPPVDNRATTTVLSPQPVDNYVDSSSSFIWPSLDRPRGGSRH